MGPPFHKIDKGNNRCALSGTETGSNPAVRLNPTLTVGNQNQKAGRFWTAKQEKTACVLTLNLLRSLSRSEIVAGK